MEEMRLHDTPALQAPIEAPTDADAWARIQSINPEALALKLAGLLSDENIQRVKQAEVNHYTADIRMSSSIGDLEEINASIVAAEEREETILEKVSKGNGDYARLEMQIRTAQIRSKETGHLEGQKDALIKQLAPLQGEYEKVCIELDWLRGGKAMLESLASKQESYVENEKPTWDMSLEYKAALGQLALALDRIDKLPARMPVPLAPPDMSSQNPADTLPFSLDGRMEERRSLFTLDIEHQIQKIQSPQEISTYSPEQDEGEPQIHSYQHLAAILPTTRISIPVNKRSRLKELMNEDSKI